MTANGYYRSPTIHETTVVFVCESDLWSVDVSGGQARRLTANAMDVDTPFLSPDGEWLAFVGRDEGMAEAQRALDLNPNYAHAALALARGLARSARLLLLDDVLSAVDHTTESFRRASPLHFVPKLEGGHLQLLRAGAAPEAGQVHA